MKTMRSLFRRNPKPKRRASGGERTISEHPSPSNSPQQPRQVIKPPSQQSTGDLVEDTSDLWFRKHTSRTEICDEITEPLRHPYDLEHAVPTEVGGSASSNIRPHPKPRVIRHSGAYPAQQPENEFKSSGSSAKKNQKSNTDFGSYKSVLPSLLNGDWNKAAALLDAHPGIARQAEQVHLHGQVIVALPLHVASCLHIPSGLFDKLLTMHPLAAQQPDDVCGRLPLHWACRSNASVHVLDKLIQTFPNACKAYDRAEDRTPLHYLAVHATNLDQVVTLLQAPVNQKRILKHKDAERKTPVELAKTSKSPVRQGIVNILLHQQDVLSSKHTRSGAKYSLPDQTTAVQHLSDATFQSMPAPHSPRYDAVGTPSRQQGNRGGMDHSPGNLDTPPRHSSSKSPPHYRFRGPVRSREDIGGGFKPAAPPLVAVNDAPGGQRRSREVMRSAPDLASLPSRQEQVTETRALHAEAAPEDDEYCSRYMKKMNSEDQQVGQSKEDQQENDRKQDSERSSSAGLSLLNEMKSNMDRLEESMGNLEVDMDERDMQLSNLEATTDKMERREQELARGLRNANSMVDHQHKEIEKKRERIASLKDRIAVLESELLEEQSSLEPMEHSVLGLEQKIVEKEHELQAHREEKDSLNLMKQSLLEEREYIQREMDNSNSELKSLKAIQDLAMGGEDNL